MATLKLIKNEETIELTQGGEYIVDGRKYIVNIDFENGKIELSYICDTDNIEAHIKPSKLSLYVDEKDMQSPSIKHKPNIINGIVTIEDNNNCIYCLDADADLSKIKFIQDGDLYIYKFMQLIENAKSISLKDGNYADIISFLLLMKFAKNAANIIVDNDYLGVAINHYEDEDGVRKKSISLNVDCKNFVYFEEVLKAINSIYSDDMEEVELTDEEGNVIYTYFKFNSIFNDNSLFKNKSFIDYNNSLKFDAITINDIVMDNIDKNIGDFSVIDFKSFLPFYEIDFSADAINFLSIKNYSDNCIFAIDYILKEAEEADKSIVFNTFCDYYTGGGRGSYNINIDNYMKYIPNVSLDVYSRDCFHEHRAFIENVDVPLIDVHDVRRLENINSNVKTLKNAQIFYSGCCGGNINHSDNKRIWSGYKQAMHNIEHYIDENADINIDVSKGWLHLNPLISCTCRGYFNSNDRDYNDFSDSDKHFGRYNFKAIDTFLYFAGDIRYIHTENKMPMLREDFLDEYTLDMNKADKSYLRMIVKASNFFNNVLITYVTDNLKVFDKVLSENTFYLVEHYDYTNVYDGEETNDTVSDISGIHISTSSDNSDVIIDNKMKYKRKVYPISIVFNNGEWNITVPENITSIENKTVTWHYDGIKTGSHENSLPKNVKDIDKNVTYHFTKNEDGSVEITWNNESGIDAKFFTIGDKKVLIPTGGN